MRILQANLKHLYQRRALWWWYLFMLGFMPLMLMPFIIDRYLGYLVISFLVGSLLAGLQRDILAKPFSFCLPGHQQISRRFLFWTGAVVNAVLGLVFFAYPGIGLPNVLLVVCAAGFAGLLAYFWGMYLDMMEKPAMAAVSMPLLVGGAIFKWDRAIQHIIISWPLLMIAAGTLACVWVWKWLGRHALHRRYCGKVLVAGPFVTGKRKQVERLFLAPADAKCTGMRARILEEVDRFFLTRIRNHSLLSRPRHFRCSCFFFYILVTWVFPKVPAYYT
jgi:hypothetical protein